MPQPKIPANIQQAATSIRRGVTQLARHMRRLRGPHGLSAAKLALLGHLYRADGPLTANDLARLEALQPQSLTRLIAELENDGLLGRQRSDHDRRQIEITLTKSGKDLLILDARRQDAWLEQVMFEGLREDEIEILHQAGRLLTRLSLTQPRNPQRKPAHQRQVKPIEKNVTTKP